MAPKATSGARASSNRQADDAAKSLVPARSPAWIWTLAALVAVGAIAAAVWRSSQAGSGDSAPTMPAPTSDSRKTPAKTAASTPDSHKAPAKPASAKLPRDVLKEYECSGRCAAMADEDFETVSKSLEEACHSTNNANLCDMSPEQFCAAHCGSGQMDMKTWLKGTFGAKAPKLETETISKAFSEHEQCADRCATEGVAVDAAMPDAAAKAAEVLRRCGVVQLVGAFETAKLDKVSKAIELLREKKIAAKLLDRKQLHDSRFQLYLPFSSPFDKRSSLGAADVVLETLDGYLAGAPYGIDHVSILTSASPNGNQSLHPDTSSFRRSSISVHTALQDISLDMGPTYFCPCTGESEEDWAVSAAIKMAILKRKECIARAHVPSLTRRGTITIYDGSTFHKGLENTSGRNRDVLKLELGTGDFPQRRDYTKGAPASAQRHVERFREAMGIPRMGPLTSASVQQR